MPLQNRVNPFGELIAVPARGTLFGNRGGRFHTDAKTLTKRRWAARHFPSVPIITTPAARKREHCRPGDVLIDDWASRRRAWQRAGGIFVHHLSATQSISTLRERGVLTA